MQLLFPLSLPPLQNASTQALGSPLTADTRLAQVRVALKDAGLQRSRIISRRAESDSLQSALAHELWLQQHFSLARPDLANTLMCLAGAPLQNPLPELTSTFQQWLLKPVHFNLALDHLVLAADAPGIAQMTNTEQWLELLKEALEPGWQLQSWISPRQESLFILSTPANMDWIPKSSTQAMGRSIDRYLPSGRDSRAWRRFLNHTQMLLHEHPLNTQREQQGHANINGFWLEGEIPALPQRLSRGSMSSLLASKFLLPGTANPATTQQTTADTQSTAVFLVDDWIAPTHQGDLEAWRDTWQGLANFVKALPKTKALSFNFFGEAGQLCIESQPVDRWRIWRLGALI